MTLNEDLTFRMTTYVSGISEPLHSCSNDIRSFSTNLFSFAKSKIAKFRFVASTSFLCEIQKVERKYKGNLTKYISNPNCGPGRLRIAV